MTFLRILIAGLLLVSVSAHGAQSYDNCTGFVDSVPITISTQGVWCLRHDLSVNTSYGAAITVTGNNVTIDCNGWGLTSSEPANNSLTVGVYASDRQNISVRQCGVRGFFFGIYLDGGSGHLVEDNQLENSSTVGIYLLSGDTNNMVRRNRVYDTGGGGYVGYSVGILAFGHVRDNTVTSEFANPESRGISIAGPGSDVRGNRIRYSNGIAIQGAAISVDGNRMAAVNDGTGTGIIGYAGQATTCRDNIAINFATSYRDCAAESGNISLPLPPP